MSDLTELLERVEKAEWRPVPGCRRSRLNTQSTRASSAKSAGGKYMDAHLAELLRRIEASTGPDREIDRWLTLKLVNKGRRGNFKSDETWVRAAREKRWATEYFTRSIDAALALVERLFGIDAESMLYNYDLGWHASAWAEMAFTADLHLAVGTPPEMQEFHGQAPTLPLAILAALLKALIAQQAKP